MQLRSTIVKFGEVLKKFCHFGVKVVWIFHNSSIRVSASWARPIRAFVLWSFLLFWAQNPQLYFRYEALKKKNNEKKKKKGRRWSWKPSRFIHLSEIWNGGWIQDCFVVFIQWSGAHSFIRSFNSCWLPPLGLLGPPLPHASRQPHLMLSPSRSRSLSHSLSPSRCLLC